MTPVSPNQYATIPLEELVVHLHFHDGVATVRDCARIHHVAPCRQLYRAVEKRRGELRTAGYRTLCYRDVGMIHVYQPSSRMEYRKAKYGVMGPLTALMIILVSILLFVWEQIKWGF